MQARDSNTGQERLMYTVIWRFEDEGSSSPYSFFNVPVEDFMFVMETQGMVERQVEIAEVIRYRVEPTERGGSLWINNWRVGCVSETTG